ncbi:MAG: site-specific DNA-methyltransferase, partial [Comamonadaceae bacterium]
MPTLNWVGKDKVVNHHHDVPFRVLNKVSTFRAPDGLPANSTDNQIIHGDNLEALKSLLPEFERKVKCIYIDPPYNTGNEGWVYNDAVNDPKMKRWLGQVVGKEGEDLSRHDKWLCMMYPRLKLLHRLLAPDGAIFVSIDDNEVQHLRPMLDEIFGAQNRIEQFIWKKSYGGGAKERYAVTVHEYILMYAKDKGNIRELSLPPDDAAEKRYYKLADEKVNVRGPFRVKPLEATKSMDARENLVYPITAPDGESVFPKRQWWWSRERAEAALKNNDLYFSRGKDGGWSVQYKQYLRDDEGVQ